MSNLNLILFLIKSSRRLKYSAQAIWTTSMILSLCFFLKFLYLNMHTLSIYRKKCITFGVTKENWDCIVRMSQAVQHAEHRFLCVFLLWFRAHIRSDLLAALTGLSDSAPVCAAALINPTLCDFVSTSLFLSLSLIFFSLVHYSNYSLTCPFSLFNSSEYFKFKFNFFYYFVPNPCTVILPVQHKGDCHTAHTQTEKMASKDHIL